LESEYNNRARVPEHPAILEAWSNGSAEFRRQARMRTLVSGGHERERIDLFLPPGAGPFPVHVYLHGGYWQLLGREWFSYLAAPFVSAGVAFAAVGYPLCPEVSVRDIVASVRASTAWLWREGPTVGVDRDRMQVCGHSAGGHLVAMLLTTDWETFDVPAGVDPIHSAISVSGVFELEPLVHVSQNQALRLDIDAARRSSPSLLAPGGSGPLLVAVGAEESGEFLRQSRDFVDSWSGREPAPEYLEIPGANHFTVLESLASADGVLARQALHWLKGG
jgi:arylformamidase